MSSEEFQIYMFHFRCPLCGADPERVLLRDYLATWANAPAYRVSSMIALLAGAVTEIRGGQHPWPIKEFPKACDRILDAIAQIPNLQPIANLSPLRRIDDRVFEAVCHCPFCLHPSGTRSINRYFTDWQHAGSVQIAILLYEVGLVLWAVLCRLPDWASGRTLDAINSLRKSLRQAGHDLGLLECPQCGRFTSCLYGQPTPERNRFCRWCLDMGGGIGVSLSFGFDANGKITVQCRPTDYSAPARNAWDILPPEIAKNADATVS